MNPIDAADSQPTEAKADKQLPGQPSCTDSDPTNAVTDPDVNAGIDADIRLGGRADSRSENNTSNSQKGVFGHNFNANTRASAGQNAVSADPNIDQSFATSWTDANQSNPVPANMEAGAHAGALPGNYDGPNAFIGAAAGSNVQQTQFRQECPDELPAISADSFVGKTLNQRFAIMSLIGAGGMSYVYKAKDILSNRIVAVKVLRPHLLHDANNTRRLHKEAQAARCLEHQNIIGMHHFDVTPDGLPFIVMDYLQGTSISDILATQGLFAPERAAKILSQVGQALAHAHSKGIIHRDLKASNVLLVDQNDRKEVVKVVDFGIAKIAAAEGADMTKLTMTGEIFGSPTVMSPEQCRGDAVDARSDIYSFGCLMYEMLTGKPVFQSTHTLELLMKQLHEMPESFKVANPSAKIPPELEAVAFKALQKQPGDRYACMKDMIRDLDAFGNMSPLRKVLTRLGLATGNKRRNSRILRISLIATAVTITIWELSFGIPALLKSDGSLLTNILSWQLQPAKINRPVKDTSIKALQEIQEIKAYIEQVDINKTPNVADEAAVRQTLEKLANDADKLYSFGDITELVELSKKFCKVTVIYDEIVKMGVPKENITAVLTMITKTGDRLYDAGVFDHAAYVYMCGQRICQNFSGDGSADDQYFAKLIGDCCLNESAYGFKTVSEYSRALTNYGRFFPPKEDPQLVSREQYRFVGRQRLPFANDLADSPLSWDAHLKQAEAEYFTHQYAKAADDFEWVASHKQPRELPPAERIRQLWYTADVQRVTSDHPVGNLIADQALENYKAGRELKATADPKNIALCDAYMAAIVEHHGFAVERLPPGVSIESALKEARDAFGENDPVTLLVKKQCAQSYWRHGNYQGALKLWCEVIAQMIKQKFEHR